MDFADAALRLAGVAGALLEWRPDEFWRATPAELGAVLRVSAGESDASPPEPALLRRLMEEHPDG